MTTTTATTDYITSCEDCSKEYGSVERAFNARWCEGVSRCLACWRKAADEAPSGGQATSEFIDALTKAESALAEKIRNPHKGETR